MKVYTAASPTSEWRVGVWVCPHCDYHSKSGESLEWDDPSRVVAIYLGYPLSEGRMSKIDSFVIESECPQCFEKSWNHGRFENWGGKNGWGMDLAKWPKEIIREIDAEWKRRKKDPSLRWWFKKSSHPTKEGSRG